MEREQAKTIDTLIHIHLDEAREGGEGRRLKEREDIKNTRTNTPTYVPAENRRQGHPLLQTEGGGVGGGGGARRPKST